MALPDLGELNLDAMDPDELMQLGEELYRLSRYAITRSVAMTIRSCGHVERAMKLEVELDELYLSLPENWRW